MHKFTAGWFFLDSPDHHQKYFKGKGGKQAGSSETVLFIIRNIIRESEREMNNTQISHHWVRSLDIVHLSHV